MKQNQIMNVHNCTEFSCTTAPLTTEVQSSRVSVGYMLVAADITASFLCE